MTKHDISEFDIFFLSYDEPNADKHWADLVEKAPWADRVHGVKGFDSAHRAAAEKSGTDWFITVDADNIVHPQFFNQQIELDPGRPLQCFSWNGINMVNGLMYGNGGLKLWSKAFVLTMDTHENSTDPRKAVDFCWEDDYKQVHVSYSEVWPNGSPYQAYRAGFREGIKLTLDRGERVEPFHMRDQLHPVNLRNARIWSCVGSDVTNGAWAMLGTRVGWDMMCDLAWDYTVIRDYDWFQEHWRTTLEALGLDERGAQEAGRVPATPARESLWQALLGRGEAIQKATKIALPALDADESEFFRESFKLRND